MRAWTAISLCFPAGLLLASCTPVPHEGAKVQTQTVVGKIALIPDFWVEVPELMGGSSRAYEVYPLGDESNTLMLIDGHGCPYDKDRPNQLYKIEYYIDEQYRAELRPGDPKGWKNNAVIYRCEKSAM